MQYMGGKSRISKQISEVLSNALSWRQEQNCQTDCRSAKFRAERERERERVFVSLFCGSCAVESKVDADIKILNDKHPYLIAMWQRLQQGWRPPYAITKEEYCAIKANMNANPALTGFVGFGCSFGGKWFGGYAKSDKKRNYCMNSRNSVLKDLPKLQGATFTCLDYKDVPIPDGAVVYCDPPYANTTGYSVGTFNSDEFFEYMRQLSKRCDVFISEEQAPSDFECIWQQELTRWIDRNKSNQPKKIEKLFKYKG